VFVIPIRTWTREFRLHTDCRQAARVLAFMKTRPEIQGAALELTDLVVQRVDGFYRLVLPDGSMVEGTALHLLAMMHRIAFASFVEETPGAPLIHAASVRVGGTPVLLVGAEGSGKTTLVLHLIERGHVVEGDEHVLVRETDLVARPRMLHVKASSLAFAPTLAKRICRAPSIADWEGSLIYAVSPAIGGRPWRLTDMRAPHIVLLEPNHGGRTVAKPVSVDRAFNRLLTRCLLPNSGKALAVGRLRRVAREAQAWEMTLGDLSGAERHLRASLDFQNRA
jgi:hypothetical protein